MSRHRECGEEIRWAKREDDHERWMPPLEFAGHAYVFVEGSDTAIYVPVYKRHDCDPERVEAWQEYIAKLDKLKATGGQTVSLYAASRELERQDRLEFAETVPCRRCGAKKKKPCINLTLLKKEKKEVPTREPHAERWADATKESDEHKDR